MPAALADRWSAAFGLDLLDGIGSTEALHIFISNRPDDVKRGTSGTLVDGYGIALRDDNGRAAATGEIADHTDAEYDFLRGLPTTRRVSALP